MSAGDLFDASFACRRCHRETFFGGTCDINKVDAGKTSGTDDVVSRIFWMSLGDQERGYCPRTHLARPRKVARTSYVFRANL